MPRRLVLRLLVAASLSAGLAACARADEQAGETNSTALTVYASLPLQGPSGPDAEAIANGERLALREAGGKVGDLTVKLVVLDDSTIDAAGWDPRKTADNARVVVRDRTAIAYLGDEEAGATAVSLPILNALGILQVSATSTSTGLTRAADADKGEPEKYYPSGRRTFGRPIPADHVQAAALRDAFARQECRALAVVDDRDFYGRGLANAVQRDARKAGLEVVARESLRADDVDPVEAARDLVAEAPDCVFLGGTLAPWIPELFDALHAADPTLELFGPDGLATPGFAAALGRGTQARTHLTMPGPGRGAGTPALKRFETAYREAFGEPPRPGAVYGYEAMRLVLASIAGAGPAGNDRLAVVDAFFDLGPRTGPLGRYTLDDSGDTDLDTYAQAEVRDGEVRIVRTLRPLAP